MKERIRFNTRSTKPKLYSLLALTIVTAIIIALLIVINGEKFAPVICILVAAYALAAALMLFWAFRQQLRYNPYSYNTIMYMGFALFTLFVMLCHCFLAKQMLKQPDLYKGPVIISQLVSTAGNYMLFTSPFILIFAIALCISNISLIRHEGKRLVNLLGIILSFLLVGGSVGLYIYDFSASGSVYEVMMHDLKANLFAAIYLYFECMLIGTIVADALAARYQPSLDRDFMIILGCGLRKDGTPTPLLRSRIDRALRFAQEQKEKTGNELIFVTSGGQGPNEVISESASMKRYLIEQGVPEERIIEENQSTNTYENMKFSKEKILAVNPDPKVAFCTNNYHVFRSGIFAKRVKMKDVVGIGAPTKWYFWPNAAVREFIGLLTKHRVKQGLVLGGMLLFYVLMTIIRYQF
ncbi:MAG: YdcF family protein [Lachnospiraceae bacterium]